MSSSERATQSQAGEVISYSRVIPYPSGPDVRLPDRPKPKVRGGGLLGLGVNRQDLVHERRITELYHLGVETAFTAQMAVGVELTGIKAASDGLAMAEAIVYAQPQDGVAAMVAADLAGDMAARIRNRHGRLAETYDAEAMNILHRG